MGKVEFLSELVDEVAKGGWLIVDDVVDLAWLAAFEGRDDRCCCCVFDVDPGEQSAATARQREETPRQQT